VKAFLRSCIVWTTWSSVQALVGDFGGDQRSGITPITSPPASSAPAATAPIRPSLPPP
jgi:hypothetical protein